jgi:hypothetical protein
MIDFPLPKTDASHGPILLMDGKIYKFFQSFLSWVYGAKPWPIQMKKQ